MLLICLKILRYSAFAIPVAAATLVPALAQNATATKQSKSLELEAVQRNLVEATRKQNALREEIALLDRDAGAINRALIETAKHGQNLETQVSEIEENLATLTKTQSKIRHSLNKKRGVLSEVIAALQRMGKNPPPAILVQPQDALASVRSSILLSSVVPHIKQETNTLFAELAALRETSSAVLTERKKLATSLNALAEDETRLTLLVKEKGQLVAKSRGDLLQESKKATELASKALSLKELIGFLETQITSAAEAAQAAKQAEERRKKREDQRLAKAKLRLEKIQPSDSEDTWLESSKNTSRIEPAIAFSKAKGKLIQPVSGVEVHSFGTLVQGRASQYMALATRSNARVRAPADGWVIYAGPFRSYGNILILNAGESYHLVLSGLAEVNVEPGRFVLAGEPVGRMGLTRYAASNPLELGSNRPVLSVELRKDGKSIDPAPWWANRARASNQVSSKRGT